MQGGRSDIVIQNAVKKFCVFTYWFHLTLIIFESLAARNPYSSIGWCHHLPKTFFCCAGLPRLAAEGLSSFS